MRVYNNTIMKNLTTATAVTSNGLPAPAGLSTSANSDQLQATLPGGSPTFSNPRLFNNIFWDNRAGTRAGTTVTGLGLTGDASPIDRWDLGVADGTGVLAPTSSVVQQSAGAHPYTTSPTNSTADPLVVSAYDVSVSFATWRQNPSFVDATLVTLDAPPSILGDYHLQSGSPAIGLGASSSGGITAPATDIDDQARPAGGTFDSGADEFGAATPPPPPATDLYFSTLGSTNPPGVSGTADDADVHRWNGTAYNREIDLTAAPYNAPALSNLDGFSRVDATHFYVSFSGATLLAGIGLVLDEDVVYFNGTSWSMWFDGSAHGVGGSVDLGAVSVVGNTLYFSTNNTAVPPGAGGTGDNADVYRWNSTATGNSFTRVVDATQAPFNLPNSGSATGSTNPDVDGLVVVDATHFYVSFSNTTTTVPGLGAVQDEDVLFFNGTTWTVFFDGTAHGLGTSANLDLDAISFATGALAPAAGPSFGPLYLSTSGAGVVPGVAGPFDSADIYYGDGTAFSRTFDASASGVVLSVLINVDGYDRVDDTHVYFSFATTTILAGLGIVQDEDVVYYDNGTWSLYFDGSLHGMATSANLDLDALSVDGATNGIGGTLYFSTVGNTNPPGVGGTADDADIYSWNGTTYSRVIDASAAPYSLPGNANVDGYVRIDATHGYFSFSGATTTVPVLGAVQDEDVVRYDAGTWSVHFDGTGQGLTADTQDVDAFDVP